MARVLFGIEKGLRQFAENSETVYVDYLFGSGAPGGDAGEQDDAPIGSHYLRTNGELYTKIADANVAADWELKAPNFLSSGYTPANGDPTAGDSLEAAIEKLDANQDDLQTLTGVAQGSVDLGTFTGTTIPDSSTIKAALQALETALEGIAGGSAGSSLAVTTATEMGGVLVDNIDAAEWEVLLVDVATEAKQKLKISGLHDGTSVADATDADFDIFSKLDVGANFNTSVQIVLNGTGASQEMRLEVASTEPSGVDVYWRRTDLP